MYEFRSFVIDGGLASYGPPVPPFYRDVAGHVDKILRGAEPGALPVQQPMRFELIFNLKKAKALGLSIPPSPLARADEVKFLCTLLHMLTSLVTFGLALHDKEQRNVAALPQPNERRGEQALDTGLDSPGPMFTQSRPLYCSAVNRTIGHT
jgi:ABC transporter substrate binding protein